MLVLCASAESLFHSLTDHPTFPTRHARADAIACLRQIRPSLLGESTARTSARISMICYFIYCYYWTNYSPLFFHLFTLNIPLLYFLFCTLFCEPAEHFSSPRLMTPDGAVTILCTDYNIMFLYYTLSYTL